jgi:4-amino-4-deoxy-L-arabinose transferase-like glycosyltransferase
VHLTNGQFFFAFVLAAVAGTLVFFHAERNRVRHPSAWASFVFLFLIVALPTYLLHFRRLRRSRGV